jgi:anhydro-N-acetylmuramic acid kinase
MGNGPSRLIAGAMSGTSADGVDVALTRITGRGLDMRAELVHHHHRPYDANLRAAIFKLRDSGQTSLSDLARLGRDISLTYALTVNEALSAANLKSSDLAAVAAHGQTLYHAPPDTIQWLDPSLIAAEVGCAVVSDFRRADCAAGGQGAPLVPFADYILFRHPKYSRALVNIGGIANVTLLHGAWPIERTVAFDTGPGNCISDHLCRTRNPGGPGFDVGGQRAMRGHLIKSLAERVLSHEYFKRPAPKSTDGPEMIFIFERALDAEENRHTLDDLLFTACWITVQAIAIGIKSAFGGTTDEIIVSGGGTKNALILSSLTDGSVHLLRTDDLGVPGEAKEALAFALLAAATLDGVPSNVPSVTGARRAVVLGSITPRP